jgi:hypothetical protein
MVGGVISAGEEIEANTIGSRLGTVTELILGDALKMQLEAHWGKTHPEHPDYPVKLPNPETEFKQGVSDETPVIVKEKWRIKVRDLIYPGVKATIGAATLFTQDEIKYSILVNSGGEIHITPYS